MTPRVVYWNNIAAPYVVERFNALADRGNVDFEAWFTAPTASDRSWDVDESSWRFRFRYVPRLVVGSRAVTLPPLRRAPDVFVSLYASAAFLAGSALAGARGARTAFWVEPTRDAWVQRRRWKDAVKRAAFSHADAIFTTGREGRAFAESHGARRVFQLPYFASHDSFSELYRDATRRRDDVRRELGATGVTFVYVGRLWSGKGIDDLLDAFAKVQLRSPDVSLVLAGDGVDEPSYRARVRDERLRNIIFAGFRQRDALADVYAAADAFVFPTLGDPFGQVVEEAMTCRLPVIVSDATGEIRDRVTDGVEGFVFPVGDADALAERMERLASDAALRARAGAAAARRVEGLTAERWCAAFEAAIEAMLAQPVRARATLDQIEAA